MHLIFTFVQLCSFDYNYADQHYSDQKRKLYFFEYFGLNHRKRNSGKYIMLICSGQCRTVIGPQSIRIVRWDGYFRRDIQRFRLCILEIKIIKPSCFSVIESSFSHGFIRLKFFAFCTFERFLRSRSTEFNSFKLLLSHQSDHRADGVTVSQSKRYICKVRILTE